MNIYRIYLHEVQALYINEMQMNQILNNLIEYDRMMKLTLGWNKQQTNRSPIKTIINNHQQFIIYETSATNIPDQKDLAVYGSE